MTRIVNPAVNVVAIDNLPSCGGHKGRQSGGGELCTLQAKWVGCIAVRTIIHEANGSVESAYIYLRSAEYE